MLEYSDLAKYQRRAKGDKQAEIYTFPTNRQKRESDSRVSHAGRIYGGMESGDGKGLIMATEIAKAYVQIMPFAKGMGSNIEKELSGGMASAGQNSGNIFGKELVGTIKKVIVAAGIGKFLQSAMSEGAKLQQSYGGLETIYGDAADAAKAYAQEAYKAGISANDYAEQAVSFGASLKQAFEGDTAKAVEAANMAILDMTDNAAKMGTPIESIQNAYQGFAKGNYTMLDNLKLGYGGTKKEMERLLAEAEKLPTAMGKSFNIENLGDVYEAIHLIQGELGLTGVAAYEASETFSGSMGAMSAAFHNFLGALATGGDITASLTSLIGNAAVFIKDNMIPMLQNIIQAIPPALMTAAPLLLEAVGSLLEPIKGYLNINTLQMAVDAILGFVDGLKEKIPTVLEAGSELISNFIQGALDALPDVIVAAAKLITGLIGAWFEARPEIFKTAHDLIIEFINGILDKAPDVILTIGDMLADMIAKILDAAPRFLEQGIGFIAQLIAGIVRHTPAILTAIAQVIIKLLATIVQHLPEVLAKGIEIIANICSGIIQSIPLAITAIGQIIENIKTTFTSIDWGELGRNLIDKVSEAIKSAVETIKSAILDVAGKAKDAFFEVDWLGVGKGIIDGIVGGLWDAAGGLYNAVKGVVKRALGSAEEEAEIGSPSRLFAREVGQWIPKGIAAGIMDNVDSVENAMIGLTRSTVNDVESAMRRTTASTIPATSSTGLEARVDYLTALLVKYLPDCAQPAVIDSDALTKTINRRLGVAYL